MCPPALYRLCLAILYVRLPALGCCGRLCLAILCLPALDVASSSFDFEKHKLFGVYGGVIISSKIVLNHIIRIKTSLPLKEKKKLAPGLLGGFLQLGGKSWLRLFFSYTPPDPRPRGL